MKQCKFFNSNSNFSLSTETQYYYDIDEKRAYHCYIIYEYINDNYKEIANFSKIYFYALFIDTKQERKEKLIKIYENNL